MWSVAQPLRCPFCPFPEKGATIAVSAMQEIYNGLKSLSLFFFLNSPAFFEVNVAHSNHKKKKRSLCHLPSLRTAATGLPRPRSKSRRCHEGRGAGLDAAGTDQQVKLLYRPLSPVASHGTELANALRSGNNAVGGAGLVAQGG